jgi:hypothetical protein
MSRPKTIGFAIVERLQEIEELNGNVIFFRRHDIESEFNRRMGKARGRAVVVRLVKATNISQDRRDVLFGGSYTVSLFSSPLLTLKDAKDADALMQEIAGKLQGWWPDNVPSNGLMRCGCGEITFPEDPDFDIAVMPVTAPYQTS